MALGTGVEFAGNPGRATGAQEGLLAGRRGLWPFIQLRRLPVEGAVGREMHLLAVSSHMDLADLLEVGVGGEGSRKGGRKRKGRGRGTER